MVLWLANSEPIELRSNALEDELQVVILAAYKQVLGNIHVMDDQRLTSAESLLRQGDISVRGFVRAVAKSELYRQLFFEPSSAYQFVEFNFKHLLGRAPLDQAEVASHVALYNEKGYDAEIDSYIDSDEYLNAFSDDIVPYIRGNQTQLGAKTVSFNRTFALMRGDATSDRRKKAKLIGDIGANLATKIAAPKGGLGAYSSNTEKRFKISVSTSQAAAAINRLSKQEYVVSYNQMPKTIQGILKRGGKILNIAEAS